jgi:tetratricopeptide (TPR) repeat protein
VLATRLEERADRRVDAQPEETKERATARGEYERSLENLQRALAAKAKHEEATAAVPRVRGKLADLLTGDGRRSQREGNQLRDEKKVPEALGKYEAALKSFDEALAIIKDHEDALAGREEVRKAMEELHLATGDRHLALGENQAKKDPGPASENLLKALDHFQQALGLNPTNESTKQRIARVNALLPDVLAAFGKEDQKSAVEAEPQSIPDAISYLERAEGTYLRALEIDPNHAPSKKGLEEVRAELERLRKKLPPPEAEKSAQPRAKSARENLNSMLNKLRSQKKEQQEERNQRVRIIREGAGGSYRDW